MLTGLSPKKNRTIPPLRYEDIYRLKEDFPNLVIELNGGIKSLDEITAHLEKVDGVMVGRAAYENPYLFAAADSLFYDDDQLPPSRREVIEAMVPYLEEQIARGVYPNRITRHMLGLFNGLAGARAWRRHLAEQAHKPGAGPEIIEAALARWRETQARQRAARSPQEEG